MVANLENKEPLEIWHRWWKKYMEFKKISTLIIEYSGTEVAAINDVLCELSTRNFHRHFIRALNFLSMNEIKTLTTEKVRSPISGLCFGWKRNLNFNQTGKYKQISINYIQNELRTSDLSREHFQLPISDRLKNGSNFSAQSPELATAILYLQTLVNVKKMIIKSFVDKNIY